MIIALYCIITFQHKMSDNENEWYPWHWNHFIYLLVICNNEGPTKFFTLTFSFIKMFNSTKSKIPRKILRFAISLMPSAKIASILSRLLTNVKSRFVLNSKVNAYYDWITNIYQKSIMPIKRIRSNIFTKYSHLISLKSVSYS